MGVSLRDRAVRALRRVAMRLASSLFNPARCHYIGHNWTMAYWGAQGPVLRCRVCDKYDWELGYPRQFYAKNDAESFKRNSAL
jgi:hypothetical protein